LQKKNKGLSISLKFFFVLCKVIISVQCFFVITKKLFLPYKNIICEILCKYVGAEVSMLRELVTLGGREM
jgi:hypothetical protein